MSAATAEFRRVLVALDVHGRPGGPLEAAAALAARLEAELIGVFVEDVNWLRMAALPFTTVAGHGPLSRALDLPTVERALRRSAADARTALEALAARLPLRWSFRVARGLVLQEILGAAEPGDLVVVETTTARGRTALAALTTTGATVLCLRTGVTPVRSVVVVADPGPSGDAARRAAARFAMLSDVPLVVLVPGDPAEARERERAVRMLLGETPVRVRYRRIGRDGRRLAEIARAEDAPVVVCRVPPEGTEPPPLRDVRASVLLLRP